MRNKQTGQIAIRVHEVEPLDYEFESEALADFAFFTSADGSQSNVDTMRDSIKDSSAPLHMAGPMTFTHGKTLYS